MAFRTNKVPAIEERTVSGSSVSFNSAFALPLKACKVSFSATQSGSGTPSPSNPRAISGVSAIGLTANSTPVSVSLGDTRYGGYVDLVRKKLVVTDRINLIKNSGDRGYDANNQTFRFSFDDVYVYPSTGIMPNVKTSIYKTVETRAWSQWNIAPDFCISTRATLSYIVIKDSRYASMVEYLTDMGDLEIIYPLATPIEISLSDIPDLSSILGNNTFSTDTGTLEITFADLQEKSASGAVASFNTALAMPLVECKTEFMCTQEAGTPSPSNPLAITGVDEVGLQYGGNNLCNLATFTHTGPINDNGYVGTVTSRLFSDFIPVMPLQTYSTTVVAVDSNMTIYCNRVIEYDKNKNFLRSRAGGGVTSQWRKAASDDAYYFRFDLRNDTDVDMEISGISRIMTNIGNAYMPYEPYISNTVTLIDLDGTRYGGYVDVVGKKLVLSDCKCVFDGSENWYDYSGRGGWQISTIQSTYPYSAMKSGNYLNGFCNWLPNALSASDTGVRRGANNQVIYIQYVNSDPNMDTLEHWKTYLENNNLEITYPLETPIEISLSDIPTLSTIIGNNSFASDSGSIELKYKDLDIAKRGNFREVFRLPS